MSADGTAAAKARRREWIGLAVIALPCLIYSMDLTVLHLAVPQLSAELTPSSAELLWIVDIYGFMIAGALVTMGTLGDRIGRRRLLMIGAAAFGATSLLAAFSTSAEMLIVARALQGIAGATLAPSTLSLIRNMFHDPDERAQAIGIWVASFSAGAVVGPLVGGLILTYFHWSAVFLINVPMMALLLVLGPVLLPEFRDRNAGTLDIVSAVQSIAAVLGIIYGVKRIAEGGPDVAAAAAIAGGMLAGAFFFARQRSLAEPLIDVALFRRPGFSAALATNILGLFMVMGSFLFIAQYLQLVLGLGPFAAAIWTAPAGAVFALGSVMAAQLVRAFRAPNVVATGLFVSAVGFAMLTQLSAAHSPWLLLGGMLTFCIGMAPIGAITTDLVMSAAPAERAGAASGISETSFELGGALGIAVLGSLFTAIYRGEMEGGGLSGVPATAVAAAERTLAGAIEAAKSLPAEEAAKLTGLAKSAFLHAFEMTNAFSAACAVLAAVFAARYLRDESGRGRAT